MIETSRQPQKKMAMIDLQFGKAKVGTYPSLGACREDDGIAISVDCIGGPWPPCKQPPRTLLRCRPVPAPGSDETADDDTLTDTSEPASVRGLEAMAPHLFLVLECSRPDAGGSRHMLRGVEQVVLGRGRDRRAHRTGSRGQRMLEIRVPDPRMSVVHARLVRHGIHFHLEDAGSYNGTRVNGARVVGPTRLEDGDLVEAGHTLFRYRAVVAIPAKVPADLDSAGSTDETLLPTLDPSLAGRVALLAPLAKSTSPLLLIGETGTGKELLARAIHRASGRPGPFVAVNCAALPSPLVESQLFGHVRGAYTGATGDASGLVRSADRGTLLLDEVGDLPAAAQAALLRVLQEHEVIPVGSARPVQVDLRVVAATHRPLAALAARGGFRRDLYGRLAGFTFEVPPVRERPDDIGLFVAAFASKRRLRIAPAAGRALLRYSWPLNVRELHHALDVAATLAGDEPIRLAHLPKEVTAGVPSTEGMPPPDDLDEPAREDLVAMLERHGGNVSEVARELGKQRRQVQRLLVRLGLDPGTYRPK